MIVSETKIRVRYAETDQAGYVYYGNYPKYYEVGRTESIRQLGHTYKELEDKGVIMPVLTMNVKYLRPAKYDDLLTVKTYIRELPETRMRFEYEIFNQDNVLINKAETTLVFISGETYRPVRIPQWFQELLKPYF